MRLGIGSRFAPTTFVGCALLVLGCNGKSASDGPGSGGTLTTTCEDGTERCACYGNGTCNAPLVCLSDLCVRPANPATGGATSTAVGQGGAVALGQGGTILTSFGGTTLVAAMGGSTNTALAAGGSSSGGLPGVGGASGSGGTVASSAGMTSRGGTSSGGTNASSGGTVASSAGMTSRGGTSSAAGGVIATVATGGNANAAGATHGAGTAGTAGTPTTACTISTNLIADALKSAATNWIGGDPTSTLDNPCGIQGKVYAFSDNGLDKVPGGADATVQFPPMASSSADPSARLSPCNVSKGGCCISGTTSKWPVSSTATDYTASVWGGGLRMSLNDPGGGSASLAYQGPIKGFTVTVAGTLNGQVLRLGYAQTSMISALCEPFAQKTFVGTFTIPFVGAATCPTWSCSPACIAPTSTPYEMFVQVVGGDAAGAFDICITSITPIL